MVKAQEAEAEAQQVTVVVVAGVAAAAQAVAEAGALQYSEQGQHPYLLPQAAGAEAGALLMM